MILINAARCQGAVFYDALKRPVDLPGPPRRIVALAPNLTEILYYLGLGDRVVGVTRYSYYPPDALKKPKVGSYIQVNVERVLELKPDLVFGTVDGNRRGVVSILGQAGIPVYVVNPRTVKETIATIAAIADVCGVGERGHRLASLLTNRVARIVNRTSGLKKPLVFLQINLRPIMTVNRHTIHHDVIRLAGGRNMTGDLDVPYPTISVEEVLKAKPDVIIISSMERGGRFERERMYWYEWPSIPAVRRRQVYLLDSDLLDRPSPRIVEGLEIMARMIHPEVQWDSEPEEKPQGATPWEKR
jgi:cobalamin transport system substrate-binding protein